jgi:hypothetical protein
MMIIMPAQFSNKGNKKPMFKPVSAYCISKNKSLNTSNTRDLFLITGCGDRI